MRAFVRWLVAKKSQTLRKNLQIIEILISICIRYRKTPRTTTQIWEKARKVENKKILLFLPSLLHIKCVWFFWGWAWITPLCLPHLFRKMFMRIFCRRSIKIKVYEKSLSTLSISKLSHDKMLSWIEKNYMYAFYIRASERNYKISTPTSNMEKCIDTTCGHSEGERKIKIK